jgi:hypothetical protein
MSEIWQTRQEMYVQCNNEACSCNHCCRGKAISITHWECGCSLSYPACNAHAPYCIMWPARLYNIFPHYFINGTIFKKKKLLHIKCVFWFSLQFFSETFLTLGRIERDLIKNVYWSSCKVQVILVRFQWNLNFRDSFSKNIRLSNFLDVRPVGAELFHADRRTDLTKLIVRFSQFCKSAQHVHCSL